MEKGVEMPNYHYSRGHEPREVDFSDVQGIVAQRKKEKKRIARSESEPMAFINGALYHLNAFGRPVKRISGALEIPKEPNQKKVGVDQMVLDRNQEEENRLAAARQMAGKKEKKEAILYSGLSRVIGFFNLCPRCDALLKKDLVTTADFGQIELFYCRICREYFR